MTIGASAPLAQGQRRRRRHMPMSDINVTPFVDVMLVLLIVFMVTAPLLAAGIPVDLPKASVAPLAMEKEPVTITIAADGRIFVKDQTISPAELASWLKSMTSGSEDRIYVRGDKTASYGTIMHVMGVLNGAGFTRLALVALNDGDG
jgi:biopolymer transport protein TolR